MIRLALFVLLGLAGADAADFSDWAAIVVAGDSYAHSGARSDVFDNGRSAIVRELIDIGFQLQNIRQFSDRPKHYPDGHPDLATPKRIASGFVEVARHATGGCLAYLTSHGSEGGIGVGDYVLTPRRFARIVDAACGDRPAVLIVSACYSGVFVKALRAHSRIVLTAAAPDRSSFGCGETDKYTYFDTCTVSELPGSGDFETFAKRAIACVEAREKKEDVDLPSNPQAAIGAKAPALIPHWKAR